MLGGFLLLLPLIATVLLLRAAFNFIAKLTKPLVKILPFDSVMGIGAEYLSAILILILAGFLAGLLAKTGLGRKFNRWLENSLLRRIPGYSLFRGIAQDMKGEGPSNFPVALGHFGDNVWQVCLIVERHSETGHVTVFVPGSPSPTSGTVAILPAVQIKEIDVPAVSVMKCMAQIGIGSRELLKGQFSSVPGGSTPSKGTLGSAISTQGNSS